MMSSKGLNKQAASNSPGMQFSSQEDGWESVPAKRRKEGGGKGGKFAQWSSPPLVVEPIPPTPQTTSFSPFMILLIGLPGSGKSTFSNLLVQAMPYKFARVNQDQLGSREKCISAANRALDEKKCVILDRCNFDVAQRATWFDLCKKRNIPIYGLVLQVPKQLCIQRCQGRGAHETIAPKDAARVVNILSQRFKRPSQEEEGQFRSHSTIFNSGMLDDVMLQFLNQNE